MEEHLQEIEEIAELAGKEFTLEQAIVKMKKEWENQKFVIVNYKGRGVKIL